MNITMKDKKKFILTLIAIAFIAVLVIGATYAYVTISATNKFGTKKINANIASVGSVALTTGSNLSMDLSLEQMSDKGEDVTYYASSNGTTTTETTEAIGKAIVTGAGTFTCDYTLTMDDNESSMYDVFQETTMFDLTLAAVEKTNQIILTINDTSYDFATTNLFPTTITGTMTGITEENPGYIMSQLKVINKTGIYQTDLINSSITLNFAVTDFTCTTSD